MESVTNDPELAQEMARLLYRKLQIARRERDELRAHRQYEGLLVDSSALQNENERLRNEVAKMRLSLSVSMEIQDSKEDADVKRSKYAGETPDSTTTQSIAEETGGAKQERAAELQHLTDKVSSYRDKYKQMKAGRLELEETRSQLEHQLRTKRAELEATQRQARDVELRLEKAREAVKGSPDASSFLSIAVKVTGCPPTYPLRPLPPHGITDIKRASGNAVAILSRDVKWHENLNRALVFAPSMLFDPTKRSGKGSWSQGPSHQLFRLDGSKDIEVVYDDGHNCYYYGTYTTLLASSLSSDEAQKISNAITQHVRDSIILHRDQVAPAICKLVEALFTAGGLPVACYAIQRVGFSIKLGEMP